MIFLIDNQLPLGLVKHLQSHGLSVTHVSDCGLDKVSDLDIWNYAKTRNCVIVSKDEDFFLLSCKDQDGPPLVWVRLGNCRNRVVFSAFDQVLADLLELINSGTKVLEIQ